MSHNTQNWKDKVAVITGAGSGIGRGLAEYAAQQGMKLVLADINEQALMETAALVGSKQVVSVPTDVSDLASVQMLADAAYAAYDRVDLLFNNAGVMTTGFSWEISPEDFQRTLDININGVLNGVRAFLPRMKKQAEPSRIVNTASIGGLLSSPLMAPYSVSKFAVIAYSESLKAEVEMLQLPISVSVLCPGPVHSDIFNQSNHDNQAVQDFVQLMRNMSDQNGITPSELAQRAFHDIEQGKFWLIPQPEALIEGFKLRNEDILAHLSSD